MPQESGIEAAIRELAREGKKIKDVISMLRKIRPTGNAAAGLGGRKTRRGRRRLSAETRRRISQAAKKRWASLQTTKKQSKQRPAKQTKAAPAA